MTRAPFLWRHYALAVALFGIFLSLRLIVLPRESGIPYLTFFPGVVICALLTGWRPTLLYIALAAPAGVFFFNLPYLGFDPNDIILVTAFTMSALFMLAAIEWYKHRATAASIIVSTPFGLSDRKVIIGLSLAILLLTLLGASNYVRSQYQISDAAETTRIHEVQTRIESLLSQVTDAETGVRGYVITGDEVFLAPYLGARTRATENLSVLRNLTADHARQQQRLDQLAQLLDARFDWIEEGIALRQRAGFDAARARITTGGGRALQDQIRGVLHEMRTTQAELALTHTASVRAGTRASLTIGILSLSGALAALGFAVWRLIRELHGRRRAEAEVRRLNATLTAHVGEMEVHVQLAARASNTGFWDWDLGSNEMYFSPEWKSQLGYAVDEIANRFDEWESRIHPDDLPGALQRVQAYLAAPSGDYASEFRMRHRNGKYRWILARAQVLRNEAGAPFRMLGSHIDITERKEMEVALSESGRMLKLVTDGVGPEMFMGLMTPDGILIDANQPALAAGGLTRQDVLNKPLDETPWIAYSAATQTQVRDAIARARRGEGSRFDMQARFAGGTILWLDFSLQPIKNAAGEVIYLVPSSVLIETRKHAEQALIASEREFRLLAEAMPQIVWVTPADGMTTYLNQRWVDYTGLTLEESYGQGWLKPFHPDDQPRTWEAWQNAVNNNGIYSIESRLRRADGVYRWWLIRGVPILDAAGKIDQWFGTCTDIEDIKQVETALREKNTELERFTYMISHDLKSPLVTIRTFLTYLEQDISTQDTQRIAQDIGYIATAAEKMSRMLEELLEFSRVGRVPQARSDVTWREIVDEALMLTAGAVATHAVQVEIDEINLHLQGERARFVQIWQNLIDNAIKFKSDPVAPTIRIGVEANGAQSVFFVCDNGVGIAPQYHAQIFGLFEKLDANTPGTGLGLALVQRIVENYGGVIDVVSAGEGRGACFRFTLPGAIYTKQ